DTMAARVMLRSTEQRASPNPHDRDLLSASLIVDLPHVLVSGHLRSAPLGFFCSSIVQSCFSQASMAFCSPAPSSRPVAGVAATIAADSASAAVSASVRLWDACRSLPSISCPPPVCCIRPFVRPVPADVHPRILALSAGTEATGGQAGPRGWPIQAPDQA